MERGEKTTSGYTSSEAERGKTIIGNFFDVSAYSSFRSSRFSFVLVLPSSCGHNSPAVVSFLFLFHFYARLSLSFALLPCVCAIMVILCALFSRVGLRNRALRSPSISGVQVRQAYVSMIKLFK